MFTTLTEFHRNSLRCQAWQTDIIHICAFSSWSSWKHNIQPYPIQWVLGALSLGVKRLWREADHSPSHLHLVPRLRLGGANLHSPTMFFGVVLS